MYVNCADSGTRAGRNTQAYIDAKDDYDEIKKRIIDGGNQIRLGDFCRYYIDEELKNARKDILDKVGINYKNEYMKN